MKISVIIPTRERAAYLRHCVATALAIPDPDVEIIVSDNCSTDGTDAVLATLHDPRLRVVSPGQRVSMRQNFEYALGQATGEYLIFFGDDDGILPGQFSSLKHLLQTHRPDCLSWSRMSYGWPTQQTKGKYGGIRFERHKLFGSPAPVDLPALTRRVVKADFLWGDDFPALYHGTVSRACIERLRPDGGDFFRAKVPDFYFTFLAAMSGIHHLHVAHSFTINGHSPASTGGSYNREKGADGQKDPASRFVTEAAADPHQDPVKIGMGIPAAFLETFEAARAVFGPNAPLPDHGAWYDFILKRSAHLSAEARSDLMANLRAYAEQTGTQSQLDHVASTATKAQQVLDRLSGPRLRAQWSKLVNKIGSFRLDAAQDGENTILTAARMADTVLGTDYRAALDGKVTPNAAWAAAKKRAAGFTRQF